MSFGTSGTYILTNCEQDLYLYEGDTKWRGKLKVIWIKSRALPHSVNDEWSCSLIFCSFKAARLYATDHLSRRLNISNDANCADSLANFRLEMNVKPEHSLELPRIFRWIVLPLDFPELFSWTVDENLKGRQMNYRWMMFRMRNIC